MNSLNPKDDFDGRMQQEMRAWLADEQPEDSLRTAILSSARQTNLKKSRRKRAFEGVRRWFTDPAATTKNPTLPYAELSQWLFSQSMWHHLGLDRRAVKSVS